MWRTLRTSVLALAAACGGEERPAPSPQPAAPIDAAVAPVAHNIGADPVLHLDDDPLGATASRQGRRRAGRPIEILLRSTPSGADVAVDGQPHGKTPVLWQGDSGTAREFTFTLAGHSLARYRFVPVTSGVVHPRLEPVAIEVEPKPPVAPVAPPPPSPPVVPEPTPVVPAPIVPAPVVPLPVAPAPVEVAPRGDSVPPSVPVGPQP